MTVEVVLEHRANAERVEVAGCFTDWSPVSMSRGDGDVWSYTTSLVPGRAVTFKFVVDGNWVAADSYSHVDDGHCGVNNTLYVSRPPPTTPKSGTDSVLSMVSAVENSETVESPAPPPPEPAEAELPPSAEPLTDELETGDADADEEADEDFEHSEADAKAGAEEDADVDTDDAYADATDAEKKPQTTETVQRNLQDELENKAQLDVNVDVDVDMKAKLEVKPDTFIEDVDGEFVEEKKGGCVIV